MEYFGCLCRIKSTLIGAYLAGPGDRSLSSEALLALPLILFGFKSLHILTINFRCKMALCVNPLVLRGKSVPEDIFTERRRRLRVNRALWGQSSKECCTWAPECPWTCPRDSCGLCCRLVPSEGDWGCSRPVRVSVLAPSLQL